MPTFDTPGPIRARIEVVSGSVPGPRRRPRTTPSSPSGPRNERSSADVTAAEQTQVTFAAGELLVRSTSRPRLLFFGTGPEIDVDVVLPDGLLPRRPHDGRGDHLRAAGSAPCRPGEQARRPAPGPRRQPARPHLQRRRLRRRRRGRGRGRPPPTGTSASARPPARPGSDTGYGDVTVDRALGLADRQHQVRPGARRRGGPRLAGARDRLRRGRGRRARGDGGLARRRTPAPAASATCSPRPRDPRAPTRPSRSTPARPTATS